MDRDSKIEGVNTEEIFRGSDPVSDTEGDDFAAAIAGEGVGSNRRQKQRFGLVLVHAKGTEKQKNG